MKRINKKYEKKVCFKSITKEIVVFRVVINYLMEYQEHS